MHQRRREACVGASQGLAKALGCKTSHKLAVADADGIPLVFCLRCG